MGILISKKIVFKKAIIFHNIHFFSNLDFFPNKSLSSYLILVKKDHFPKDRFNLLK